MQVELLYYLHVQLRTHTDFRFWLVLWLEFGIDLENWVFEYIDNFRVMTGAYDINNTTSIPPIHGDLACMFTVNHMVWTMIGVA